MTTKNNQESDGKMKRVPLISNRGALSSVRYFGLETSDAVKELVDNALDADATEIRVHVIGKGNNITNIVVEDNGHGIPKSRLNEVVAFGGRIEHERSIGRFGFGLPSAICSQTKYGEVYSKVEDGDWNFVALDLDKLMKMENPMLDPAEPGRPPKELPLHLQGTESGTVVRMRNCDRIAVSRADTLEAQLIGDLGETYRYYIAGEGTARAKIFVNGEEVRHRDPLMRLPNCMYSDEAGYGKEPFSIDPLVFEGIIDPDTGAPAEVRLRVSFLDVDRITSSPNKRKLKDKVGINVNHQGFSVVRQHREIADAQTMWLIPRHNRFNYVHWEMQFPPVLDDFFGIQTHKGRFHLQKPLRTKLQALVDRYTPQVEDWAKRTEARERATDAPPGPKPSVARAAAVEKTMRPSRAPPLTTQQREELKKDREARKRQEIEAVETATDLTGSEKETRIKVIEGKYEFKGPFEIVLEANNTGHFYDVRPMGDFTQLVYNTAHPFYTEVYERAVAEGRGMDDYIDLLIMTLARAELMYLGTDTAEFYIQARADWTAILRKYLRDTAEIPKGDSKRVGQELGYKPMGEV